MLTVVLCIASAMGSCAQTIHFVIETNMGTMKGFLYDDTPGHRDEFVRLVREGHYDNTLFYRCVKDFVIQGGSSDSRNAKPGQAIGYGSDAVNIDSEFRKGRYHKRGAICAPRQPEKVNVMKTSDISQFYIVQGRVYSDEYLTKYEKSKNNPIRKKLRETYYEPRKEELARLKDTDKAAYNALLREIKDEIEMEYRISDYKEFTAEERATYTTTGGIPQLDGEYTVFGEITEGLEVLAKIANLTVDANSRPLKDVRMTIRIL